MSMHDWKEIFSEYLTSKGAMRSSLSSAKKTEIFAYRISDRFIVLGNYGATNKDPVLCECRFCGYVGSIVPAEAVRDNAACKSCAGKNQKESKEGILADNMFGITLPEHILHILPSYVGIIGSAKNYKGVSHLNTESYNWKDLMYHDMVFVVRHGNTDNFSVFTCKNKFFKDRIDACLWGRSIPHEYDPPRGGKLGEADDVARSSRRGHEELQEEPLGSNRKYIACQTHGHIKHEGAHVPNGTFGIWYTRKAPLVKFAIELKFINRRYWPNIGGGNEEVYYKLTQEDLDEISKLEHIDDALNWPGLEPAEEAKIWVYHDTSKKFYDDEPEPTDEETLEHMKEYFCGEE